MKTLAIVAVLLITCLGCARRQAAFHEYKRYLETTPFNAFDAEHVAGLMDRVCRDDDCIPFLWQTARGTQPEDAVAACSIMSEIIHAPQWAPSDLRIARADAIDQTNLMSHLWSMQTNGLSPKWIAIHHRNMNIVNRSLEPATQGDVQ